MTQGRSSGSTVLPNSAFAQPACSRSETAMTSSVAPKAPAPTRIATFSPAFSTSAACCSAALSGSFAAARIADARMCRAMNQRRVFIVQ